MFEFVEAYLTDLPLLAEQCNVRPHLIVKVWVFCGREFIDLSCKIYPMGPDFMPHSGSYVWQYKGFRPKRNVLKWW